MPHYQTECQDYRTLQLVNIAWHFVCHSLTLMMASKMKLRYTPDEVIREVHASNLDQKSSHPHPARFGQV